MLFARILPFMLLMMRTVTVTMTAIMGTAITAATRLRAMMTGWPPRQTAGYWMDSEDLWDRPPSWLRVDSSTHSADRAMSAAIA